MTPTAEVLLTTPTPRGGRRDPRVFVFAPAPLLTITIEARGDGEDVHLHAGGQGFWIARMVAALGVRVVMCGSFGGETGAIVRTLVEREGVEVCGVDVATPNVAYVHDRRAGEREPLVEMSPSALSRHEVDELYGAALVAGIDADICILGGPPVGGPVLPADTYRRLARDLRANGTSVVADLGGEELGAALVGGVDVLKVSDSQLVRAGRAPSTAGDDVLEAARELRAAGAGTVVISRAEKPAIASYAGAAVVEILSPDVEPVDTHGGGDSMTAGIAAALARGDGMEEALRLGAAAGRLNVTRRGLATGRQSEIERMAEMVELRPVVDGLGEAAPPTETATVEEVAARVGRS